MKNGNGNFVIVITETAVVIEHLVDTSPWDVAKKILAGHNTSLVEVVTFPEADGFPGICGLIAEEGKIENLYLNMVASVFYHKAFRSEPDFNDLKNKIISCGLSLEDVIPFAWGYKSYGMSVELHPKESVCGLGNWIHTDWLETN